MVASSTIETPSKSAINRAGATLAELFSKRNDLGSAKRDEDALAHVDDAIERVGGVAVVSEAYSLADYWRGQHRAPMVRVNAGLRHYIDKHGCPVIVTQRLKKRPTMIDKLGREPNMQLTTMYDIGGVRVRLPNHDTVMNIVDDLRGQSRWDIREVRNYVDGPADHSDKRVRLLGPKPSGYRAVHLAVVKNGRRIEVQLRTPRQDLWANTVERDTRNRGVDFKSGSGHQVVHDYYRLVSDVFALLDAGQDVDTVLMDEVNAAFEAAQPHLTRGTT